MLIPYNTDAPLYHIPFGTVGLIVANCVIFWFTSHADARAVEPWMLQFGKGLHPVQWISGSFLHAGYLHIVGNMFYLWGFGLVVEGKIGWWRFLTLYLTISVIHGAIIQTVMLGGQGAALGASGVIFGLMAISLVWAPKNEMSCFLWFIRPVMIELPITVFATTYLILQIALAWWTHFSMSSEVLHLTGAAVGAPIGIGLLKLKLVDCEGWDLFAVMRDQHGAAPGKTPLATEPEPAPQAKPLDEEMAGFLTTALRQPPAERRRGRRRAVLQTTAPVASRLEVVGRRLDGADYRAAPATALVGVDRAAGRFPPAVS